MYLGDITWFALATILEQDKESSDPYSNLLVLYLLYYVKVH